MSAKEDALQEIVTIARNNSLTLDDITAALTDTSAQEVKAEAGVLSRLLSYIGGIFVFSGICVFVSMFWDDFGSAARVAVTLGTGYLVFIIALACLKDARFEKAATPLFIMSSALQPGGIFVMLNEYSSGGNPKHGVLFMAIIMLIQHAAAFWHTRRTTLAFTSLVFGGIFFAILFDLWDVQPNLIGTVMGTSLICIAYALGNSRHEAISGFWYLIGSIALLFSVFDAVGGTPYELAFLGVSAFMVFLSTSVRSRALLIVSTISMISYIAYFTAEHFADTLGWPLALIIGGLSLIGLSALAVKLNNKYIKKA